MLDNVSNDGLLGWLLGQLNLEATVFHAGRYCGAWQASTQGRWQASFHLVLDGECWLHRPGQASVRLQVGDSVLFLKDEAHHLSPAEDPHAPCLPMAMQPLGAVPGPGTGLACGFFWFQGDIGRLLTDSLAAAVLVRAEDVAGSQLATVFQLLRTEAGSGADPDRPSPLLTRLVEVLLFYALRQAAASSMAGAPGLWALARTRRMDRLLADVLADPAQDWTVERMAQCVHMSRSNFCRHFTELTGYSPAAFLTMLRMRIAAQRLESGDSIERAAGHVGYRSSAAFSRAFKKVIGEQPGSWRRSVRVGAGGALL